MQIYHQKKSRKSFVVTHLLIKLSHLQIDGTLLAPPSVASWSKSSLFQWINLKWVSDFTIQGNGTLDGQGSSWWSLSATPRSTNVSEILSTANILKLNEYLIQLFKTAKFQCSFNLHLFPSAYEILSRFTYLPKMFVLFICRKKQQAHY